MQCLQGIILQRLSNLRNAAMYTLTLHCYNIIKEKMGKRKNKMRHRWGKKKEKGNVIITTSVDGKDAIFAINVKLEGELFGNFKKGVVDLIETNHQINMTWPMSILLQAINRLKAIWVSRWLVNIAVVIWNEVMLF